MGAPWGRSPALLIKGAVGVVSKILGARGEPVRTEVDTSRLGRSNDFASGIPSRLMAVGSETRRLEWRDAADRPAQRDTGIAHEPTPFVDLLTGDRLRNV